MSIYHHIILSCIISSASLCSVIGSSPTDLAQPIPYDYHADDQNESPKKKKGKSSKAVTKKMSKRAIHAENIQSQQITQTSVVGQVSIDRNPQSAVGQIGGNRNPQSIVGQIGVNRNPQSIVGQIGGNKNPQSVVGQIGGNKNPQSAVGQIGANRNPQSVVGQIGGNKNPQSVVGQIGANRNPQSVVGQIGANRNPQSVVGQKESIISNLLTDQSNQKPVVIHTRPIVVQTVLPKPIIIQKRSAICPFVTLTPLAVAKKGNYIELNDGSIWKVRQRDRSKVRKWSPHDAIVIETGQFFSWYSYNLVNYSRDESVDVELFLANDRLGNTSHWISEINPIQGYVRLENGSIWRMSTSELASWSLNDDVIIGLSKDWFSSQYNYILINPRAKSRFTATFEF